MKYWKFIDKNGKSTSVQSCSNNLHIVPEAIEIDKTEYDEYLSSLPHLVTEKVRDLPAEFDDLKARVEALEKK